ncbi:hypothetical protein BV898_14176 [Hypsibius exemplaris]|uniref:Uncharacterized protein n=1 Tax=Hypsibius exemplaris TaxID=2072580 RepID=A0A1W0W8M6_HYPEX|nr:hypothetical protein BV898_14176 [Hypsibius exemplaris]
MRPDDSCSIATTGLREMAAEESQFSTSRVLPNGNPIPGGLSTFTLDPQQREVVQANGQYPLSHRGMASVSSNSLFSLSATTTPINLASVNMTMPPSFPQALQFNAASRTISSYATNGHNSVGGIGPVLMNGSTRLNSTIVSGNTTGRLMFDSSPTRSLAYSGLSSSNDGSPRRDNVPKMSGFFAQQSKQSAVAPTATAIGPPSISVSPVVFSNPGAESPTESPAAAGTTIRLKDIASNPEPFNQRPSDLLLHIFNGQPVFETANGKMMTEKQLNFMTAYFHDLPPMPRLEDADTHWQPSQRDANKPILAHTPDLERFCQTCLIHKPLTSFSGPTATMCCICSTRKPSPSVAVQPIALPLVVPKRRGRKRKEAPTDVHPPDGGAPFLPTPSPRNSRPHKTTKVRIERVVQFSAREVATSVDSPPPSPSTSRQPAPVQTKPIGTKLPSTDTKVPSTGTKLPSTDTDEDVIRAAPLYRLLRSKPMVQDWNIAEVGIFISCIRGMATFADAFREKKVSGSQLWRWCGMEDGRLPASIIANMAEATNTSACMTLKLISLLKLIRDEGPESDRLACCL